MKRNIHKAKGYTNLEVVNNVEGGGVLTIRLSNREFELSRSLSEQQLAKLISDLQSYQSEIRNDKIKFAVVNFYGIEGSSETKDYYFLTDIVDLANGDYVFVDSDGTNRVGKFKNYIAKSSVKTPTKNIIRKAKPVTTYI